MTQFKHVATFGAIMASTFLMPLNTAIASTVFEADAFYQQQNYEQALQAYLAAAETGSPYAYYQLGTLYYKGQGTKASKLSALIWFSLAAEYQFNDSENIVKQLLENLDNKSKADIDLLVKNFKKKYGKQQVEKKYLPELITANLTKKVNFGGEGENVNDTSASDELFGIKGTDKLSDKHFDDFSDFGSTEDPFDDAFANPFDEEEDENGNVIDEIGDIQGAELQKINPLDFPFLALIDYEVSSDGSIRNITNEYSKGRFGNVKTAIYEYSLYNLPKPTFDGKRINFFNRGYLGIARLEIGEIRERHKDLYDWVRRNDKKLKNDNTSNSNYKRAMLLTYYPWFPQEDGLAVSLFKKLAEEGHVNSQYEYGMYLYREQIDPAQAIKLLSLASQFGLTKAQYALARILQESPWVVSDEKKAIFWYEKAANKAHHNAFLRLAELKLLANDESLRNQARAIDILKNIEQAQSDNPEYHYLVAISHLKDEFRDFTKVVRHLRLAIARGHTLNWDVSKWEEQLAQWTTGVVTISD